ncbi:MAG: hypothetical protein OEV81_03800 [Betaproteobacteria bacterium]|nr:hypothetical protein [Betaproteobacteria bacterium]MDH5222280.1 hypothetical protein [Betaproteobacteria bacterium]MDH5351741.1 hypothetical protein [Betaproteobacteria bacterium]
MDREAFLWQVADGRLPPPRVAATLDDTMGPALACQLAAGEFAPTLNLNISFLKPAKPGKQRGVGRVVRRGKYVCYLSGELSQNGERDGDGAHP